MEKYVICIEPKDDTKILKSFTCRRMEVKLTIHSHCDTLESSTSGGCHRA